MERVRHALLGERKASKWIWVGLAGVVVLTGTMMWLVMPDLPWFAKAPVALIAVAYMGLQTLMYLARDDESADEDGPDQWVAPPPEQLPPRLVLRIQASDDPELIPESNEPSQPVKRELQETRSR
jgi:hypothetical protein